jgi:hypothetical protein
LFHGTGTWFCFFAEHNYLRALHSGSRNIQAALAQLDAVSSQRPSASASAAAASTTSSRRDPAGAEENPSPSPTPTRNPDAPPVPTRFGTTTCTLTTSNRVTGHVPLTSTRAAMSAVATLAPASDASVPREQLNCRFFGREGFCFRGFRCHHLHADCSLDDPANPCASRELRHVSQFEQVDTTQWLRRCWIRGQRLPEDAIANSSILLAINNCISARRLQTLTATDWTGWIAARPDLRPILSGACMELAVQTFLPHSHRRAPGRGSSASAPGLFAAPFTGVPKELLTLLPVHTVVATDTTTGISCAVCQESAAIDDHLRTLPCLHRFHVGCIDQWLTMATTCPLCKTSVVDPALLRFPGAADEASARDSEGA